MYFFLYAHKMGQKCRNLTKVKFLDLVKFLEYFGLRGCHGNQISILKIEKYVM